MNVVFVNCTYETFTPGHSGAICTWIHEVCQAAQADGVNPLLITRRSEHPQYQRPNTVFVDYPHLPSGWLASRALGLQKKLAGWVRPRQEAYAATVADAIKSAGAKRWPLLLHNDMELASSLRRRLPDSPILHLAHNLNGTTRRYRSSFARSVDMPMAVSDFAARWNERFYAMPIGSVKTVYNGVNLDAFRPRSGVARPVPVIGFVGKLVPEKGPDLVLKAAIHLAKRTRRFAVQIVGRRFYDRDEPDAYVRELDALAEELRAAGVDCRFTGWVDRAGLPAVMAEADIHVTPSRWDEPFGLTTLEAMACGSAVVGAKTGGTMEVIADAGFGFSRGDDIELADVLEPLLCDASFRAAFGCRARARAEMFSWRRTWTQIKDAIAVAEEARRDTIPSSQAIAPATMLAAQ